MKKYIHFALFLTSLLFFSYGCNNDTENSSNDNITEHPIPSIKINPGIRNPFEHAATIIGLNINNMERPNSIEDGYHMVGRMPAIDQLKKSPFLLHQWAVNQSDEIQRASSNTIRETIQSMYETINGGPHKDAGVLFSKEGKDDLIDAYRYLCSLYGEAGSVDGERIISESVLTTTFKKKLGQFIFSFSDATRLCRSAFANLSKEELAFLVNRPERYFFPNNKRFDFMTGPTDVQYKIVTISRKIDFEKLYMASVLIAEAIDLFSAYLLNPEELFLQPNASPEQVKMPLSLPSPAGDIVVLGTENNLFRGYGAIVIDLGGNDQYFGRLSSGHLTPGRIQVSIDRAGDDTYDTQHERFGQGSGCLSIGILNDLSGNDIYVAGDLAQGVGLYGVGLLFDRDGDDYYRMNVLGQGFGAFGMGGLIDNAGNDRYLINGLGQGAGSTMGIGLLCDQKGRDKYIAKKEATRGTLSTGKMWSHVQGAGLSIRSHKWRSQSSMYGGIGILSEGGGADFYYAEHGNCMGSSYFMSLGVLVDHEGNDKYIPKGGYGMASAVHWTASAFIDKSGDDSYFGATQTGGVASDRSVAIMVDYAGNDVYGPTPDYIANLINSEREAENKPIDDSSFQQLIDEKMADVSYGAAKKPNAFGLLIDYKGDDRYYARKSGWGESCGGVMPPKEPKHWSHGLLMDLSGKDVYSKSGRKDNHYHLFYSHGICYDTEYAGTDIFSKEMPIAEATLQNLRLAPGADDGSNPIEKKLHELVNLNIFQRFREYGTIVQYGEEAAGDVAEFLLQSDNQDLNQDLTQVLAETIAEKGMTPSMARQIEKLLAANDPFVRLFAARMVGWRRSYDSRNAVVNSLGQADSAGRSHLIWALGKVDRNYDSIDLVVNHASNDPLAKNRLAALIVLNQYAKNHKSLTTENSNRVLDCLLNLIDDDDKIISAYAAKGLAPYGNNLNVVNTLRRKTASSDEYVKRFAAQSLIRNGVREAIPVLIETLTFPSIDTFKHYDHDLAKELAFYCGVDFPEETRYLHRTWQSWWQKNGSSVDLNTNLNIMHAIEKADESDNVKAGIDIFETLLIEYPENTVIPKRYSYFCNHWITYNYLTLPDINREIIADCIQLQNIMIRLEPDNTEHRKRLELFENWLVKI